MAWQDTLLKLRNESADIRSERQRRAEEEDEVRGRQRAKLTEFASTWGIPTLLAEMNRVLLDGRGKVETLNSWETQEDEDTFDLDFLGLDEGEDDEEGEVITTFLSWNEQGQREIAVDLGQNNQGFYLQVNGVDVHLERGALEQALVEAFRDELDL